ncbi:MAG: hypothetical protein QW666_04515 [Candidatus Woesearchaeota archaeon]
MYNSFTRFLKTKKYSVFDFLEPLLVLPLAYAVIQFVRDVNPISVLVAAAAFIAYLPAILAIFKWRRK